MQFFPFRMHSRKRVMGVNSALALLSTFALTQAAVIEFDVSPIGTDDATGLSVANEVHTVVRSTGTGDAVSGGISFDTETSTLNFTMGYGSAAGFRNLTGAATSLHLHGPAPAGASAAVLFDLAPAHFPAPLATNGGVIFGSILFSTSQAADLLAGLNYVNIHTAANPAGEIRGQLIRLNTAPEVVCTPNATVECGTLITYSASVSDVDAEAVQAIWTLNGVQVQTNNITAGDSSEGAMLEYKARLPLGINTLAVTATDTFGNVTNCVSTITSVDTIAPVIVSVTADPKVLWPPNHKMVKVRIQADVTDACGSTKWKIISVESNQNVDPDKKGDRSPDWNVTSNHTLNLRAERAGNIKSDRVYTITVRATDTSGNRSSLSTVKVVVPHDKR